MLTLTQHPAPLLRDDDVYTKTYLERTTYTLFCVHARTTEKTLAHYARQRTGKAAVMRWVVGCNVAPADKFECVCFVERALNAHTINVCIRHGVVRVRARKEFERGLYKALCIYILSSTHKKLILSYTVYKYAFILNLGDDVVYIFLYDDQFI